MELNISISFLQIGIFMLLGFIGKRLMIYKSIAK